MAGGHAPQNGWPCKLVRSTGFPYRTGTVPCFHFDRIIRFWTVPTITVPYVQSENGDTAYKHSTGIDGQLPSQENAGRRETVASGINSSSN